MSIGKPISLPSWVVACFSFHDRYCGTSLSAPTVFRSTKRSALGRKEAMSSPLMPVMSGADCAARSPVSSLVLKSPPTTEVLRLMPEKCFLASATTLSLRPPDQYQRLRFLLSLAPLDAEPPPHAAVAPAAAAVSTAA